MAPVTGRHSVIDSPDPVRRVEPPRTTMANTRAATANSHTATGRDISWSRNIDMELGLG